MQLGDGRSPKVRRLQGQKEKGHAGALPFYQIEVRMCPGLCNSGRQPVKLDVMRDNLGTQKKNQDMVRRSGATSG